MTAGDPHRLKLQLAGKMRHLGFTCPSLCEMDSQITKFHDWNWMLRMSPRMGNYNSLNLISSVLVTIPPRYSLAAWQHWKWNWSWTWWNCHANNASTIRVSGVAILPWHVVQNMMDVCYIPQLVSVHSPMPGSLHFHGPYSLCTPLTLQYWIAVLAHCVTEGVSFTW